jgi:hypothetical protein
VSEIAALFTWRHDIVVVAAITGEIDLSGPRPKRWIHASEDDAIAAVLAAD